MNHDEFYNELRNILDGLHYLEGYIEDLTGGMRDRICGILNEIDGSYARWVESAEGDIIDAKNLREYEKVRQLSEYMPMTPERIQELIAVLQKRLS